MNVTIEIRNKKKRTDYRNVFCHWLGQCILVIFTKLFFNESTAFKVTVSFTVSSGVHVRKIKNYGQCKTVFESTCL